ncbi:MAG TPA: Ig-like domain-containing protein [Myxococcales bacterium]|jgi:hypothetical protein
MSIDRIEKPVAPPYAAGSARGGGLLSSSNPAVVEADANGMLVAHRNGTATIRSRNGVTLEVSVRAAHALRIEPPRLALKVGAEQVVEIKADGEPVDGRAIRWLSEDPSVAVGTKLKVIAGRSPGLATLTATLGDARATLPVQVDESDILLRVTPPQLRMTVGSMQQLHIPAVYSGAVEWTTSNANVIQHLHDGLVLARATGHAGACASARGTRSCTRIDVGQ